MNRCIHCNYEWKGNKENPKACPRCKTYQWKSSSLKFSDSKPLNKGETDD